MSIAQTLRSIREHIETSRAGSPVAAPSVNVLAASKAQPVEKITEAIEAGITDFGENRVQEAEAKWPDLKRRFPQLRLHLIGPLQTNKVKQALTLFDVIQTVDRAKLAEAIAHDLAKAGGPSRHQFYLQVNIGNEPQKAGVLPGELGVLAAHCRALKLPVAGLMCIPPQEHPPAPYFALLRDMGQRLGLQGLSMGMSEDYETAVRMGATCVRLGRILFGERVLAEP